MAVNVTGGGDPVTVTASDPAASMIMHGDAAVNTALTITIPPPPVAGWNTYITAIDLIVSNDATGAVVATNLAFTTTNLWGWKYVFSMVGTANTNGVDRSFVFQRPVIAQMAGQPITLVSPAANAHAAYSANIAYYYAP